MRRKQQKSEGKVETRLRVFLRTEDTRCFSSSSLYSLSSTAVGVVEINRARALVPSRSWSFHARESLRYVNTEADHARDARKSAVERPRRRRNEGTMAFARSSSLKSIDRFFFFRRRKIPSSSPLLRVPSRCASRASRRGGQTAS